MGYEILTLLRQPFATALQRRARTAVPFHAALLRNPTPQSLQRTPETWNMDLGRLLLGFPVLPQGHEDNDVPTFWLPL